MEIHFQDLVDKLLDTSLQGEAVRWTSHVSHGIWHEKSQKAWWTPGGLHHISWIFLASCSLLCHGESPTFSNSSPFRTDGKCVPKPSIVHQCSIFQKKHHFYHQDINDTISEILGNAVQNHLNFTIFQIQKIFMNPNSSGHEPSIIPNHPQPSPPSPTLHQAPPSTRAPPWHLDL